MNYVQVSSARYGVCRFSFLQLILLFFAASLVCPALQGTRADGAEGPKVLVGGESNQLADINAISTVEMFERLCGKSWQRREIFEACRKKLPVFGSRYLWVSTRYLVRDGETLTLADLGTFYGLSGREAEPARLALGAILTAWCQEGKVLPRARFGEFLEPRCRKSLPTLAEMGLSYDPAWAGIEMRGDTYDGPVR